MFKKLNLPNKLTLVRIILVPLFLIFMFVYSFEFELVISNFKIFDNGLFIWLALGTYILASITDFLDGSIARKNNLITKFGKLVDPLADKLLVASGFIMLTEMGVIPGIITAFVICRDLWVGTLRMFASSKNVTVAAHLSGKIKTVFTMPAVIFSMLDVILSGENGGFLAFANGSMTELFALLVNVFMTVLLVAVCVTTVWSLVDYTLKTKKYIDVE